MAILMLSAIILAGCSRNSVQSPDVPSVSPTAGEMNTSGEYAALFTYPLTQKAYEYFLAVLAIPRGSHNEQAISDYLVAFAQERGLEVVQDQSLNVLIKKPGSSGREDEDAVILQAHMDMVCEKNNGVDHDFTKDPIIPAIDGDWIYAEETTLGADNACGVSILLALLDSDDLSHPPIEALITTNEEDGMTGAAEFDVSLLSGKRFINVDSEWEYLFVVSCAGSIFTEVKLPAEYADIPPDLTAYTLSVAGLVGGHSGIDIARGHANANILMGRLLEALGDEGSLICDITGGSAKNAIPRECTATVLFPESAYDDIASLAERMKAEFMAEFPDDTGMSVTFEKAREQTRIMTADTVNALIACILKTPNGVISMSPDMEGLVQTSSNLGVIVTEENVITMQSFSRSSVNSELEQAAAEIRELAESYGGTAVSELSNPVWEYKADSPLRSKMAEVFVEVYGTEPSVEAIHAGLECGAFIDRMPDCDFISIGPDIESAHSPDERMRLSSYDRTCNYIVRLLERL